MSLPHILKQPGSMLGPPTSGSIILTKHDRVLLTDSAAAQIPRENVSVIT